MVECIKILSTWSMFVQLIILICVLHWPEVCESFRVLDQNTSKSIGDYFKPYDKSFVGKFGDPRNLQRERTNEGALQTPEQELLFEGSGPRQICPNMVGPFSDGNFYCTAREFGYCDRRSGTCFCNMGYGGIDCSECTGTHFRQATSSLCVPRTLCKNDCSGAGECNFYNGKCTCLPHRTGDDCSVQLCTRFSPICEACSQAACLRCRSGFYLTGNSSNVCSSCYDFDPRCAGCTKDLGCTVCADPLLTSVRRSGKRRSDPPPPLEEATRELSLTLPFGTKSPDAFAEAEHFLVSTEAQRSAANSLNIKSTTCDQGLDNDENWKCKDYEASHIVCGHAGVFKFSYPNYIVPEKQGYFRMAVSRSGGGYGNVSVSYYIRHFTTTDSDMVATAMYTTSQRLVFEAGVVERTFLVKILDDNIVEEDETFQVVLEVPEGGGSVGPQFRTNVTILDDDIDLFSPTKSVNLATSITATSNASFTATVQAAYPTSINMSTGGETLFALLENYYEQWANPGTPSESQRHSLRQQCPFYDKADGTGRYVATCEGIKEQGKYQLRTYHAFNGGLMGQYYYDAFFQKLAFSRLDDKVNFTWGTGKLATHTTDYVTIRWSGLVKPDRTDTYHFYVEADDNARLWIDDDLMLDHWHETGAMFDPSRGLAMKKNRLYEVVLEYREIRGEAHARLMWKNSYFNMTVITSNYLYALFPIGRPLTVVVKSGPTYAETTECTGDGIFKGVALKESTFQVCPRDAWLNMRDDDDEVRLSKEYFSAELYYISDTSPSNMAYDGWGGGVYDSTNPNKGEYVLAQMIYNLNTHCFDGRYTPQRAGVYSLNVVYQSQLFGTKYAVAGAPFTVRVTPSETFGPYSRILGLSNPLNAVAGSCYPFTIEARDGSQNRRLTGGDDFQVYSYQIDYYSVTSGTAQNAGSGSPTGQPSGSPTSGPTKKAAPFSLDPKHQRDSPPLETYQNVVRYGTVKDNRDGTYLATICPVIQGTHELHILLNGRGVSNQPYRIIDKWYSYWDSQGAGTHRGTYVDKSPYMLVVQHSAATGFTTTALGSGILSAVANVPSTVLITVRDSWDNVLRTNNLAPALTASIAGVPAAQIKLWNYENGSYTLTYSPVRSGTNLINIFIDGGHISGSPFSVNVTDGRASEIYSVTSYPAVGAADIPYYFQVYAYDVKNNRKMTNSDNYTYIAEHSSGERIEGDLRACPEHPDTSHAICDPFDTAPGHYFGTFTPHAAGQWTFSVFLHTKDVNGVWSTAALVIGAPFKSTILPGKPIAENCDINGPLYDNTAGETAAFKILLRDASRNALIKGGYDIEFVLLGVGVEWGTILPWGTTPGLPNQYHYRGFYSGYPNVYGEVIDKLDGTYMVTHAATKAGQYVARFTLAEPGLNASYFNSTDFGYLVDNRFFTQEWVDRFDGQPRNLGTTISWTGDVGGAHGARGDRGTGSYYGFFKSRLEHTINFDYSKPVAGKGVGYLVETASAFSREEKFREEHWAVRYTGMVTPPVIETFTFHAECDADSAVRVWIGGVGTALNGSSIGDKIIDMNITMTHNAGEYSFTDSRPREIVVEYVHFTGLSSMRLLWSSPSTPKQVIPASAFTHWRNMSHYNTTIHPAPLSPIHSTAYGEALTHATVGQNASFTVYARDRFGNLMQKGYDYPSMVAYGRDGTLFRGKMTDYGNSTYLIEYHPTVSGEYLMYVTMGCCPPHPNVGIDAEIHLSRDLYIEGAPFILTVAPGSIDAARVVAAGAGTLGGIAGVSSEFSFLYRDMYSNPTSLIYDKAAVSSGEIVKPIITVLFIDRVSGNYVEPKTLRANVAYNSSHSRVSYTMLGAGEYDMHVMFTPATNKLERKPYFDDIFDHPSFAPTTGPVPAPPTGQPSGTPSSQPSVQPTQNPSGQPTSQPSNQPSSQPTGTPTRRISRIPTYLSASPSAFPLDTDRPSTQYRTEVMPFNLTAKSQTPIPANSLPVVGSPFRITVFPGFASAATSLAKGVGLRQGAVDQSVAFEILIRDSFKNDLKVGGDKLYVRLVGGSTFSGAKPIIPDCRDKMDGKYRCEYSAEYPGRHELQIRLLTSQAALSGDPQKSGPGGGGLQGSYFSSHAPQTSDVVVTTAGGTETVLSKREPAVARVDKKIAFSWPTGHILPIIAESTSTDGHSIGMVSTGQFVRWEGYVVPPRDDQYTFLALTVHMNASVYIESELVFDTSADIALVIHLLPDVAYEIRIEAQVLPMAYNMPVSIELVWQTPTVKQSQVGQFFLYPSAENLAYSPFPVIVDGHIPSKHRK